MGAITSVRINRAEGYAPDCGPRTFTTITQAEGFLRVAARTAPATGGYDKCDFKITFSDGNTYEGRIDLQRVHTAGYSIGQHVIGFLEFISGMRRPAHLSEDRYRAYLAEPHVAKEREPAIAFLAQYRTTLEAP